MTDFKADADIPIEDLGELFDRLKDCGVSPFQLYAYATALDAVDRLKDADDDVDEENRMNAADALQDAREADHDDCHDEIDFLYDTAAGFLARLPNKEGA